MPEETLHHRGTTLVRRMTLEPGEATRWHVDPFHRVSVVLNGGVLAIEFPAADRPSRSKWRQGRSTGTNRVTIFIAQYSSRSEHRQRAFRGNRRVLPGPPRRCPAAGRSPIGVQTDCSSPRKLCCRPVQSTYSGQEPQLNQSYLSVSRPLLRYLWSLRCVCRNLVAAGRFRNENERPLRVSLKVWGKVMVSAQI